MNKYKALKLTIFQFILVFLGGMLFLTCKTAVKSITSNDNEIQAKVVREETPLWSSKIFKTEKDLENLFLVDQNIGFASNSSNFVTTFYKSSNGGESWENISTINNYDVNNIYFFTSSKGFALASDFSPLPSKHKDKSYIMKTEDGGETWKNVFSSDKDSFRKITFNNEGIGVVVGRKFPSDLESANLVLLSTDNGTSWTDISADLNKLLTKSNGQVADFLTDGIILSGKIIVLSVCGKISQTSNLGNSWELISELNNEPEQTGIRNFGLLRNGGFWLSGGAISYEGQWGMLAVKKANLAWERYRLDGYYFSDVMFLSDKEVIAVGPVVLHSNSVGENKQNKGVILYSTDSGENWSIIYESQTSNQFNHIIKLSEQKFYIIGTEAVEIVLEKKKN